MEVRAVAATEEARLPHLLQLLTALAGHEPEPIDVYEMVLRCQGSARRQEMHLRHLMVPPSSDGSHPAASRWIACQYSRPTWGDLMLDKLPASVRTATHAPCAGPDVPAFWKGLGFEVQYQHYKRGHTFDVRHGEWVVHVLVSRLHRVAIHQQRQGGSGIENGATVEVFEPAEEISPSCLLVEVWTAVESRTYTEAIAAVLEVGKLMASEGVELGPLPAPPRGPYAAPR